MDNAMINLGKFLWKYIVSPQRLPVSIFSFLLKSARNICNSGENNGCKFDHID